MQAHNQKDFLDLVHDFSPFARYAYHNASGLFLQEKKQEHVNY